MKKWYKSKTIIFNVLITVLLVAEQSFSLLQSVLGESVYGVVLFTLTIGNVILRTVTNTSVVR